MDTLHFAKAHRSFSERVERVLMQVVILGLVAIVLVQTFQVMPFIRRQINLTEAMEGISDREIESWSAFAALPPARPVSAVGQASAPAQPLTLTVVLVTRASEPAAKLLLDGQVAADFRDARVTIRVKEGQQVILDGSRVAEALNFRVVGAQGLTSPAPGESVTTKGTQQSLGYVRLGK